MWEKVEKQNRIHWFYNTFWIGFSLRSSILKLLKSNFKLRGTKYMLKFITHCYFKRVEKKEILIYN